MITTENVWHFIAFGFLPLPGLLSRDEALAIREEIERLGHERGQVPGDTATERGGIGGVAAVGERVRALMLDERVYDIPAKILGHDFTYEGSDAQWHVGDTPWHGASGVEQKPLATIKVSFYLDDLDEEIGPTRFIPGSHRAGRRPDGGESWQGREEQSILCNAGDVVIFRSEVWHRGSANHSDRVRHLLQVSYSQRGIAQRFPPYLNRFRFDPEILAMASGRQRRLLGDHPRGSYD
jgi:hypothetical protein